jgi:hypothetical protein
MVRICPNCGLKNYEGSFWCKNCKNKLIDTSFEKKYVKIEPKKESEIRNLKDIKLPYQTKTTSRHAGKTMLKVPLLIIFVGALIFSCFYIITNLGETNFNWSSYGGYSWTEEDLPWENMDFPWTNNLCIYDVYESWGSSYEFYEIGSINDDYWFENDRIYTNTGWKFELVKVKECKFTARVLDYYVYNQDDTIYEAVELISPLDIFFGYDDIVDNPDNYPYRIISNYYRGVYYEYSQNGDYFKTHQSNTHIIPHNREVYDKLLEINVGDVVKLNGSYVNLYGTHSGSNQIYTWLTDDDIGDSDCEIILVDTIEYL